MAKTKEGMSEDHPLLPGLPATFERGAPPDAREVQDAVARILWERYAPAGVVVDAEMRVLRAQGPLKVFLEDGAEAAAGRELFKIVRRELAGSLWAAFQKAMKEGTPIRRKLLVHRRARATGVQLDVLPLSGARGAEPRLLVVFNAAASPLGRYPRAGERPASQGRPLEQLRWVAPSPSRASRSSRRELQSVQEELEATRERLQESNEQLVALNAELGRRNVQLNAMNNDLSNLLASSHIPILLLDGELRLRRFTPSADELFRVSYDVGRVLSDARLGLRLPELKRLLLEVARTGRPKELEVRERRGRWFTLSIRPYRTVHGKTKGLVVSFIDTTDKKAHIQALKDSNEYAEAVIDTIKESLLILDSNLRVKRVNRPYFEAFRAEPGEIEGRSIFELGKGLWNAPALRQRLYAVLRKGEPFTDWECELDLPSRGRRLMAVSGRVIGRGGGERDVLVVLEDVSDRKQAAEFEALRKSEARQREFIANVTHELMTPITAIKGYSESLISGALEDSKKRMQFTQIIERQADRLTQLVEDLLDLSSLEARRGTPREDVVSLRAFAKRLVMGLLPAARKQRISIKVVAPPRLRVRITKARLSQVLQNLVENAVKYGRRGGRIAIGASRSANRAVVTVQDDGIGVAKEELSRIFDRFHRADDPRARAVRGSGLGLSIARSILESRGCQIWAESAVGKGSTFYFTLPLA